MTTEIWAISLVFLASIVIAFGALFLKLASKKFSLNLLKLLNNKNLILGVILYSLGTILFIPALKGGELSVLYPLISLSYVWIGIISTKFLNETMNKNKWAGIIIIIIGVMLVGLGS